MDKTIESNWYYRTMRHSIYKLSLIFRKKYVKEAINELIDNVYEDSDVSDEENQKQKDDDV